MSKPNHFWICLLIAALIILTGQLTAAPAGNAPGLITPGATKFLNPEGLSKPAGFTQVVMTGPGRLVYVSGQTARDATGNVLGKGDLGAQVTQAMENLKTALSAAGATMEDVIKLNYYVVNLKPDQVPIIREVRKKYLSAEHPPASTLVGVTALVQDDLMIEVEAIAAVRS